MDNSDSFCAILKKEKKKINKKSIKKYIIKHTLKLGVSLWHTLKLGVSFFIHSQIGYVLLTHSSNWVWHFYNYEIGCVVLETLSIGCVFLWHTLKLGVSYLIYSQIECVFFDTLWNSVCHFLHTFKLGVFNLNKYPDWWIYNCTLPQENWWLNIPVLVWKGLDKQICAL